MDDHRRMPWIFLLLLVGSGLMLACRPNPTDQTQAPAAQAPAKEEEIKLFDTVTPKQGGARAAFAPSRLRIIPGNQTEAETYYNTIRPALVDFPKATLAESSISDMLTYYGFPALVPGDLETLSSAVIMDFEQLRRAVSNAPDFEPAYRDHPLQAGEILVTRFFAPKIINVRDPQVGGVPVGGFGWRKVLRFRARAGSPARTAGLDFFYLLFNFTSNEPKFPESTHAGQIQAILVPVYPTQGRHRDAYFLVYLSLGDPNPGKVGFFLKATFDLAGAVPDDKYFVPRACGQCHGTVRSDQKGAKVNYLDTDHWIDRTGDDFTKVKADDVLVDGVPQAYTAIRQLNGEIEQQNAAVITSPSDPKFALLAVRKWLELHKEGQPDANAHILPLRRGLAENAGDAVWKEGESPDQELLPLLNQYCFRCHSSVRYHVFQKQAVIQRKDDLIDRITTENMPQDRKLDADTKAKILKLLEQL